MHKSSIQNPWRASKFVMDGVLVGASELKRSPTPATPAVPMKRPRAAAARTPSSPKPGRAPPRPCRAQKRLFPSKPPDPSQTGTWEPLQIGRSELNLPLTFPTGQTFTWRSTGADRFTGPVGSYLVSLRHHPSSAAVSFLVHNTNETISHHRALPLLRRFLNLEVSLARLWNSFSAADPRFAALAPYLAGARVLRQDPVECLFQFLCSSNNNIARITKMVAFLSSLGGFLGSVGGFDFFEFPSLERLELVSEQELRQAGFGYRAKYIVGAVKALQAKPGGGAHWLASLRELELSEVIQALCTLPGVGPKVAACVALFSLDQHSAIPVDTHVWQIAAQYLTPELAGARLTPALSNRVAEAFVKKYGEYAGWAQTALFIGELPSQKILLPSHLQSTKVAKPVHKNAEQEARGIFASKRVIV